MSFSRFLLVFAVIQVIFSDMALAVTLDREGKGPPPTFFTCRGVNLDPSKDGGAGGNPFFSIWLKGQCTTHTEGTLLAWTVHDWKNIVANGEYNYDLKTATEDVYDGPNIIFSLTMNCNKNPWAHGVWSSGCSPSGNVNNKTGTTVNGPYPLSAKYMDTQLMLAIRKAESTPTTAQLLNDWNPYENTGGATAMDVKKPNNYESVPDNIPYYMVDIQKKPNFAPINSVAVEVEALEEAPDMIGDIALPKTNSHWWQPLYNGAIPASAFPFPFGVSNGLFSGKTGKFRIRARGKKPQTNNQYVGGWTAWRNFCIGLSSCSSADKQFKAATDASNVIKSAQVKSMISKNNKKSLNSLSKSKMPSFGSKVPNPSLGTKVQNGNLPAVQMKTNLPRPSDAAKVSKTKLPSMPGGEQQMMKKSGGPNIKPYAAMNSNPAMNNTAVMPKMGNARAATPRATAATGFTMAPIKKPSLWFDTSKPIANPTPVKLHKPFGALLSVKNLGEVANGNGIGKNVNLVMTCTPLTPGGKCTRIIAPYMPEVAPGQTKTAGHLAMFKIEKYGDYKVAMSITPAQSAPGRLMAALKSSWTWNISLKSKLKMMPAAIIKSPPKVPPMAPKSSNNSNGASSAPASSAPRIKMVPR